MTIGTIDDSQRGAAKVAGSMYLFAMATSIFAEVYVRANLVSSDAAKTAANIAGSESLFRLAIVLDLVTVAADIALITALYVLLEPVDRNLAMAAAFFRIIESAILAVTAVSGIVGLRLLSGADYLRALAPEQLQALARVTLSVHNFGLTMAFIFLGLGGGVFAYLLFKSRYVPSGFGGLGIVAYAVMVIYSLTSIMVPSVSTILSRNDSRLR